MPGINGQELITELRKTKPDMPAIVILGFDEEVTQEPDQSTKIYRKPVTLYKLNRSMDNLIEK